METLNSYSSVACSNINKKKKYKSKPIEVESYMYLVVIYTCNYSYINQNFPCGSTSDNDLAKVTSSPQSILGSFPFLW